MVLERESTTTRGEWTGTTIQWDDGGEWRPLKLSFLQYKYMTQKRYVPMTVLVAYGVYSFVTAVAERWKRWIKSLA
jgi:hypothetical protein